MAMPSGYKRLEYIQSSGTQYVNSNFKANQDTRVVIDFEYISGDVVFGAYDANGANGFGLQAAGGKWYIYYGSKGSAYSSTNVVANTRLVADLNKNVSTLNGNALMTATVNTFTGANPLIISGLYNASAPGFLTALKIYSCKIYDNGTLVRDFVPCQTTAGEIGLWDDINSAFYGNAGTGTFESGPEVGVATPENFRLSSSTENTATLAWDAVDGATGYKLYRDGVLISTLTETSYTDTVQVFSSAVYAVTAYNDDGESETATLTYYAAPENPILYLVTDRTAADVAAQSAKGTYKASDLNRVGEAMNYVADRLRAAGYDPHINPKTDWKDDDWVDQAEQAVYLGDLAELRKQFALLYSTPEVPPRILATGINTNDGLTHTWANDIEKILEDIDLLLTNAAQAWFYSGELFSGEV